MKTRKNKNSRNKKNDFIVVNIKIELNANYLKKKHFKEVMLNMIEKTTIKTLRENDCEDFSVSFEINNPNIMRVVEKWKTLKGLHHHLHTNHAEKFLTFVKERINAGDIVSVERNDYKAKIIATPN